jgi:hypothetical protein
MSSYIPGPKKFDGLIISIEIRGGEGARKGAVVEALLYQPKGHVFDSQWCHWNLSLS